MAFYISKILGHKSNAFFNILLKKLSCQMNIL